MSSPTHIPASLPHQSMRAIGFKVGSVVFFISMASLIKASGDVPPGQLVFFRSIFGIVPIVILLAWRGQLIEGMKTDRPMAHFWRALVGVVSLGLSLVALTKLPLPEAVAMGYATPILIVIFGAIFLKENVRLYRWSAVAVGLIGVAIIAWPRLTVFSGNAGEISELTIGAIAALVSTVFSAFAAMHVRHLVQSERSATIVLYFSVSCTLFGLLTLPFGWEVLMAEQWAFLVVAGFLGGVGQILMTEAYRHGDVSVIAPFEYTSLLFSIVIGYLFFNDVPTITMLIGGTIVVGAGLFIIWREHALGLERRRAREVTPPGPG